MIPSLLVPAQLPSPPVHTAQQFKALQHYMASGGSVLMMLGEGGESRFDTNINYLLEQYGVAINSGEQSQQKPNMSLTYHPQTIDACRKVDPPIL